MHFLSLRCVSYVLRKMAQVVDAGKIDMLRKILKTTGYLVPTLIKAVILLIPFEKYTLYCCCFLIECDYAL